jgi:hypothetical protein
MSLLEGPISTSDINELGNIVFGMSKVDSGEEPAIFFTRGGGVGGYLSLGGVEIEKTE